VAPRRSRGRTEHGVGVVQVEASRTVVTVGEKIEGGRTLQLARPARLQNDESSRTLYKDSRT